MTALAPDPLALAADLLDPPPHPYAGDVKGWAENRLDEHLTEDQQRIAKALVLYRYVAVPSAHDVGKSFLAARMAAHWIDTHPPGEAFVVTTAPSWSQVRAILWRELARAHRKGKLPGRLTEGCEWKLNMGFGPDELVAYGRKPADYDPAAFQGIHSRYPLILIDEAGGVPKSIYDAADSLATNENARILAVGNPDDPATHFGTICKPGSGWHVIHLDGLRSPNFTREAVAQFPKLRAYMIREGIAPSTERIPESIRALLLSPRWVAERIDRWGVKSPLLVAKVRGQFPTVTTDTLIQPRWVTAAQYRELEPLATDARLGVDVARYGPDWTILLLRLGGHCRVVRAIPKGPVTEVAGVVLQIGRSFPAPVVANVDDTGVGGGVTDILVEEGHPVLPMIAGGTATDVLPNGKPRYVNARSEWWWTLREALAGPSGEGHDGWLDLDPEDEELAAQILAVRYRVNRHGQIEVESKDEMRKRGLDSPDRGDALVMALVTHVAEPEVDFGRMMTADLLRRDVM